MCFCRERSKTAAGHPPGESLGVKKRGRHFGFFAAIFFGMFVTGITVIRYNFDIITFCVDYVLII